MSEYTTRKGRSLQKTCRILPELDKKKDQTLSDTIIQFYDNYEYNLLWIEIELGETTH